MRACACGSGAGGRHRPAGGRRTEAGGLWHFDGQTLTRYGEDDGLPAGSIRGIVEDEAGILWLGIYEVGLVKFDGQTFETWTVENEPPFNQAGQILETADGQLWFVPLWGGEMAASYDPGANTWDTVRFPI